VRRGKCAHCRSTLQSRIMQNVGEGYSCDTCQVALGARGVARYTCPNLACSRRVAVGHAVHFCHACILANANNGSAAVVPQPAARLPAPPRIEHTSAPYRPGPTQEHRCYRELPRSVHPLWLVTLREAAQLVLDKHMAGDVAALDSALLLLIDLPGTRLRLDGMAGGRARTHRRLTARLSLPIQDAWVHDQHDQELPKMHSSFPRAIALARAGLFAKAASSLLASTEGGMYSGDNAPGIIRALHPQEVDIPNAAYQGAVRPNIADAIKRVRRRGVAPGPSGWTWELLAPLAKADAPLTERVLDCLVTRFLAADCAELLRERLTSSRLILLSKKGAPANANPRPVAIGELFLRLASHACMPDNPQALLEPTQVGVGTPGGVEKVIHWARDAHENGQILLTLDMRNAFNTVKRAAMAARLSELASAHSHWANACALFNAAYVRQSNLFSRWGVFHSASGSRQGCVFGGLLFATVLHGALRPLVEKYPGLRSFAFLDDLTIAFHPNASRSAGAFVAELKAALEPLGLALNETKSHYLHPDLHAAVAELDAHGFQRQNGMIKVLGSFIGDDNATAGQLAKISAGHAEFFKLLQSEELHRGVAYDLLRYAGVPRLNHAVRTHRPSVSADATQIFDAHIMETARRLLDISDSENLLGPAAYAQLTLPLAQGGFALPQISGLREMAYNASTAQFGPNPAAAAQSQAERTRAYWGRIREELHEQSEPVHRARLLSCEGPGCWLLYSSHFATSLEWRIAAQVRLRAQVLGLPDIQCKECGERADAMSFADHAFLCRKVTGYTAIHRHDRVLNAIMACLRRHMFVVVEAHTGMHEGSQKADFILYAPALRGRLVVDVSLTHPCAKTSVATAAIDAGSAARAREQQKCNKHGEAARSLGCAFSPWVFESFGRWGEQVTADMLKLESMTADPGAFRRDIRKTIAMAIQSGNADMLAHAVMSATHGLIGPARPECHLASAHKQLRRTLLGSE